MGREPFALDSEWECPCVGRNVDEGEADRKETAAIRMARLESPWTGEGGSGDGSSRRARGVVSTSPPAKVDWVFLDGRSRIPN